MKAYILLNTELGKEAEVIKALSGVNEIKAIFYLYGIYDVIIEVEADTMDKVKEVVFNHVRRLDNVKSTITLITYGDSIKRN